MDLEAARLAYEHDGFVHGGAIMSREEAAELAEELDRYVDANFLGGNSSLQLPKYAADLTRVEGDHLYQFGNLFEVSEPFRRLVTNRTLAERAAYIARTATLQLWVEQPMSKPARNGAFFRWHQDAPYHAISITPSTNLIGAWVALDDCDAESGCMWMVPGSHRWGVLEPHIVRWKQVGELSEFPKLTPPKVSREAVAEWQGARACPVRAGEVHFHHPLTWHGSPANRSDRPRRADALHYLTDGVRLSERGDPRVPFPPGTPMIEARSPRFPLVYPFS